MCGSLHTLAGNQIVIDFDGPGVLGVGRDDVVIGSSIRCGVVDLRV